MEIPCKKISFSTTPLLPIVLQLMDLIIFNFESTGKVILKTKEELYKQGILFLLWSIIRSIVRCSLEMLLIKQVGLKRYMQGANKYLCYKYLTPIFPSESSQWWIFTGIYW